MASTMRSNILTLLATRCATDGERSRASSTRQIKNAKGVRPGLCALWAALVCSGIAAMTCHLSHMFSRWKGGRRYRNFIKINRRTPGVAALSHCEPTAFITHRALSVDRAIGAPTWRILPGLDVLLET